MLRHVAHVVDSKAGWSFGEGHGLTAAAMVERSVVSLLGTGI